MKNLYDKEFYQSNKTLASSSAEVVVPLVHEVIAPSRVLDVGCGSGAWLRVWQRKGADVLGVDGDYVQPESLLISPENFKPVNLVQPLSLEKQFDLVQCLEVAEHIPQNQSARLVKDLCTHAPAVLFSSAPKGQGGVGHINEQPYEYWRGLFAKNDYVLLDYLRPLIISSDAVRVWYKYNLFLFVKSSHLSALPDKLKAAELSDGKIPDYSPLSYRFKKWVRRLLPESLITELAKHRDRKTASGPPRGTLAGER